MASTPENQSSKPTAPPETLGWTAALFNTVRKTITKASRVETSTDSTPSTSQKSLRKPSPKPLQNLEQNLEGFDTVHSPDMETSKTSILLGTGSGVSMAASSTAIQKLQQKSPSVFGRGTPTSTAISSKSPWKASPVTNGMPQFSVGNLKPAMSKNSRGPLISEGRPRSNRYRRGGVFSVRRPGDRRIKRPIGKDDLNKALTNARPFIEASKQKIDSDRNRTAFFNKKITAGGRLFSAGANKLSGRLPSERQPNDANSKFLKHGKRDNELNDQDNVETAPKRRKFANSVAFESSVTAPIENLVSTPGNGLETRAGKRKNTPYRATNINTDNDEDENGNNQKMASASDRRIVRAQRSPSSKTPHPNSGVSNTESPSAFPVMPRNNVVEDYSNWSTPDERESSEASGGNAKIPKNYFSCFPPTTAAIPSSSIPYEEPQFDQKPLFKGQKKDRTVNFDDDDDDDDDDAHVDKRQKTETNASGNVEKVGVEGWGNTFAHLTEGKIKCSECLGWFDKNEKECPSCGHDLSTQESDASKNNNKSSVTSTPKEAKSSAPEGSIGSQGFTFGAGSGAGSGSGAISSTGFSFGNSNTTSKPSAPATTGGFSFQTPSTSASGSTTSNAGFQFPSAAATTAVSDNTTPGFFQSNSTGKTKSPSLTTTSKPSDTAEVSAKTGGFTFGATTTVNSEPVASVPAPAPSPTPAASNTASKPFTFGTAPAPSTSVEDVTTPAPPSGSNVGAQLFGNFAASSVPTQSPKFQFGANKDTDLTSEAKVEKASAVEPTQKRQRGRDDDKNDNLSNQGAPPVLFGGSFAGASTKSEAATTSFAFGSSATKPSVAPTDATQAPNFSFGTSASSSSGASKANVPTFGSANTEGNNAPSAKKKRSNRDDDSNTGASNQQSTLFGSTGASGGASASGSTQAGASAPFVFGKTSTTSTKDENPSTVAPSFGSSAAPPSFGNTSTNSQATPSAPAPTPAPSFGTTPTSAAPMFGSASASTPAPAAPFVFGSTPAGAPAASTAQPFGSTAPMAFGSTPAPGPVTGFGSTPASTNAMNFSSTTPVPPSTTFGSAQVPAPAFGAPAPVAFGSATPTPAFGSTPAAPPQPFGNSATPSFNSATTTFGTAQSTPGAAPMAFGAAPPAQNPTPGGFGAGGFGQPTMQQPSSVPNAGFSLGTGGGGPQKARGGRRRIVRARRPK